MDTHEQVGDDSISSRKRKNSDDVAEVLPKQARPELKGGDAGLSVLFMLAGSPKKQSYTWPRGTPLAVENVLSAARSLFDEIKEEDELGAALKVQQKVRNESGDLQDEECVLLENEFKDQLITDLLKPGTISQEFSFEVSKKVASNLPNSNFCAQRSFEHLSRDIAAMKTQHSKEIAEIKAENAEMKTQIADLQQSVRGPLFRNLMTRCWQLYDGNPRAEFDTKKAKLLFANQVGLTQEEIDAVIELRHETNRKVHLPFDEVDLDQLKGFLPLLADATLKAGLQKLITFYQELWDDLTPEQQAAYSLSMSDYRFARPPTPFKTCLALAINEHRRFRKNGSPEIKTDRYVSSLIRDCEEQC